MTTVEEDAARIRAVIAALEGPQRVWIAEYETGHEEGFELFASEASARAQLIDWLKEERSIFETRTYRKFLVDIGRGRRDQFDDGYEHWYSIVSETVNP